VLGRVARTRSLDEAARLFRQAAGVAEAHDLALWRARALHELATIRQLRSGDPADLDAARLAAVACGAPGLVAAVDFHIAAVLGATFKGRAALPAARRCIDLAGVLDDARGQAWGWMLCGQAHLTIGEGTAAGTALDESDRRNPGDPELSILTAFLRDGLGVLLSGDISGAAGVYYDAMNDLAELSETVSPLPPWYLGPLLLTALDHERADDARRLARRDELRVVLCSPTLQLALAVAVGRRGELDRANEHAAAAFAEWDGNPATDANRHLATWLASGPAAEAGWGDPRRWLFDTDAWASEQGLPGVAASCRARLRSLGASPRRNRSRTPVPRALQRFGLTGREVDVLGLLPEGLSNAAIGERLHISTGTVKGYMENLLVKTGAANRSALAILAAEHGLGTEPRHSA
jgi:DNA-binding CsgD family transcriptional regulator